MDRIESYECLPSVNNIHVRFRVTFWIFNHPHQTNTWIYWLRFSRLPSLFTLLHWSCFLVLKLAMACMSWHHTHGVSIFSHTCFSRSFLLKTLSADLEKLYIYTMCIHLSSTHIELKHFVQSYPFCFFNVLITPNYRAPLLKYVLDPRLCCVDIGYHKSPV